MNNERYTIQALPQSADMMLFAVDQAPASILPVARHDDDHSFAVYESVRQQPPASKRHVYSPRHHIHS